MTWFTSLSTVALLALGTRLFPDRADERAQVDAFFGRIG